MAILPLISQQGKDAIGGETLNREQDQLRDQKQEPKAEQKPGKETDTGSRVKKHVIHYPLNGLDLSHSKYYHRPLTVQDVRASFLQDLQMSSKVLSGGVSHPRKPNRLCYLAETEDDMKKLRTMELFSSALFSLNSLEFNCLYCGCNLDTLLNIQPPSFHWSQLPRGKLQAPPNERRPSTLILELEQHPQSCDCIDSLNSGMLETWMWETNSFATDMYLKTTRQIYSREANAKFSRRKSNFVDSAEAQAVRMRHHRYAVYSGPGNAVTRAQRGMLELCQRCRDSTIWPLPNLLPMDNPHAPSRAPEDQAYVATSVAPQLTCSYLSWFQRANYAGTIGWSKDVLCSLYPGGLPPSRPLHYRPKRSQSCPPRIPPRRPLPVRVPTRKTVPNRKTGSTSIFQAPPPPKYCVTGVYLPVVGLDEISRRTRRRSLSRSHIKDMFRLSCTGQGDVAPESLLCKHYINPGPESANPSDRYNNRKTRPKSRAGNWKGHCTNCGRKSLHTYQWCNARCGWCGLPSDDDKNGHKAEQCPVPPQHRCKCAPFPTFHSAKNCPLLCSRRCGHPDPPGSNAHRNAMTCRSRCCMCGERGHSGKECKLKRCRCGAKHLGQDCRWKVECVVPDCDRYLCFQHCWDCGSGQRPFVGNRCRKCLISEGPPGESGNKEDQVEGEERFASWYGRIEGPSEPKIKKYKRPGVRKRGGVPVGQIMTQENETLGEGKAAGGDSKKGYDGCEGKVIDDGRDEEKRDIGGGENNNNVGENLGPSIFG